MRLIDADALKKQIEDFHCKNCDNYNFVRCRACHIDDAISYLDEAPTVNSWISVKDKMPVKSGGYMVYTKNDFVWFYYYHKDVGWIDSLGLLNDNVTHWKPLPEPEPPEVGS